MKKNIFIQLNHFAIQQKLAQHCKLNTGVKLTIDRQIDLKNSNSEDMILELGSQGWCGMGEAGQENEKACLGGMESLCLIFSNQ